MKKYQWCIPYLAVVLGMFIATKYDLTLARWFYHPNQPLGIFFECIALLPIEFMIPICFFGLFQRNQHVVNGAGFVISTLIILFDVFKYWFPMHEVWWHFLPVFLLVIVLFYRLLHRIPMTLWDKHEQFLRFYLTVALLTLALTFGFKSLWGRVRFREMAGDDSSFTPWYVVNGYNNHHSFPSAHTAMMSLILCRHMGLKMTTVKQKAVDGVLVLAMMVTRMMMGAHFFSDVLIGFTITYTLILLIDKMMYGSDRYGTTRYHI